jgi:hypothetical protein
LCFAPFATTHAQSASGVGDDAIPVPKHGTRIHLVGLFASYDSRFGSSLGGSAESPLFSGYNRNNLGVADIPRLAVAQDNIRSLSGVSNFSLTLGKLEAKGDVVRTVVPFQLDFGITRRLSLSVLVPYVETRANNKFVLNRGGTGANVGQNPARLAPSARTNNGAVLAQIAASQTALTSEIARCGDANATGGGCNAIRNDPGGAQSLLTQSASFATQLKALYGDANSVGAPMVPIAGSTTQHAIEDRLTALRSTFSQFASNDSSTAAQPAGAVLVYASSGLQQIAKDSAFGLAYDTLTNGGRAGIGDIDVVATYLVFDSFGASQSRRLFTPARGFRTSISGGWRFGSANGGRSESPFDVPTGVGANALLFRTTTDFIVTKVFWMSGTLRYTKPMSDLVVTRFPGSGDSTLFRPFVQASANRSIGTRTEFEIAPRLALGTFFGVSMAYDIGHQQASTLKSVVAQDATYGSLVTTPSSTAEVLQLGLSYSTLGSFARGQSRWPIEVIYSHGMTVSGSGMAPAENSDRIELRIYTRFPRR